MQIKNQEERSEESDPYSLFLYAIRSDITRDYYVRRLRIFFNHINLLGSLEPINLTALSNKFTIT